VALADAGISPAELFFVHVDGLLKTK